MSNSPPEAKATSLHIAVDMDDVLVDFVGGLLAAIKTEYNVEIPEDDITQWDLHPVLDPIIGYSWWTWLKHREWLWANFPAIPGAIGSIDRLRNEGHYLELVTSKPRWAEHNVWKWLGKWRPALNRVTIVTTDQISKKSDFTQASVLIDDKAENCLDFLNNGRNAILFASKQNKGTDLNNDSACYANDWQEVLLGIEEIKKGRNHGR